MRSVLLADEQPATASHQGSGLDQARVMVLLDAYQRALVVNLQHAKALHDLAFDVRGTIEHHVEAHLRAETVLRQAQISLAALRDYAVSDPDPFAGPQMAAPIVLAN